MTCATHQFCNAMLMKSSCSCSWCPMQLCSLRRPDQPFAWFAYITFFCLLERNPIRIINIHKKLPVDYSIAAVPIALISCAVQLLGCSDRSLAAACVDVSWDKLASTVTWKLQAQNIVPLSVLFCLFMTAEPLEPLKSSQSEATNTHHGGTSVLRFVNHGLMPYISEKWLATIVWCHIFQKMTGNSNWLYLIQSSRYWNFNSSTDNVEDAFVVSWRMLTCASFE